jgi:hypothetical protein
MEKSAAVFLCLAFGATTVASAANAPVRPAKKAAALPTSDNAVAKAGRSVATGAKAHGAAAAPEAFGDPYATPLLLNAKPLQMGRP